MKTILILLTAFLLASCATIPVIIQDNGYSAKVRDVHKVGLTFDTVIVVKYSDEQNHYYLRGPYLGELPTADTVYYKRKNEVDTVLRSYHIATTYAK